MKKSEKNPNIKKFSRKEEDQPCHQEESLGQSTIRKHQVFKPHDREILSQPCNQETQRNSTLQKKK